MDIYYKIKVRITLVAAKTEEDIQVLEGVLENSNDSLDVAKKTIKRHFKKLISKSVKSYLKEQPYKLSILIDFKTIREAKKSEVKKFANQK